MALPASDLFSSGLNQPLTDYSASWTVEAGGFQTNTDGVCYSTQNQTCYARWNADSFNTEHYSEVVIGTGLGGSSYPGAAVGVQSGAASGYYYIVASGSYNEFGRTNSGSDTIIDSSGSQAWATGDVLRMEKTHPNGSTTRIVVKHAPAATPSTFSQILSYDDTSGSRLSNGSSGLAGYGNNVGVSGVTSWAGGNMSSGASAAIAGSAATSGAGTQSPGTAVPL